MVSVLVKEPEEFMSKLSSPCDCRINLPGDFNLADCGKDVFGLSEAVALGEPVFDHHLNRYRRNQTT